MRKYPRTPMYESGIHHNQKKFKKLKKLKKDQFQNRHSHKVPKLMTALLMRPNVSSKKKQKRSWKETKS